MLKAATPAAYQLLHEGSLALANIEATGIRIDLDYLDSTIASTSEDIRRLEAALKGDPIFRKWKRRFGGKAKLGSKTQLGEVIFDEIGYKRKALRVVDDTRWANDADEGKPKDKNDEAAFAHVDDPFIKHYFHWQKLLKARDTYLIGLRDLNVDGYIHPNFNLHVVRTYRSSSDRPNFQNFPVRNEEMARLIRSAFIPSSDEYQLIENDFGGIEVCVVACYNRDPVLIDYINDPTKDMHRDQASACFMLPPEKIGKKPRYCGKNMLVFPEFYGSYYVDCARNLWEALDRLDLRVLKGYDDKKEEIHGRTIKAHLAKKGITELGACDPDESPKKGTFEHHIQNVEERLWDKFKVYDRWKQKWWEKYCDQGYIETLTGFVLQEVYRRNQIINSPVQGSAFHICLMTLILMERELRKRKMKSRIVGQIHDSIIGNVHVKEKDDYLAMMKHFATVVVPKMWKWIIVPLKIEAEVAPPGQNWHMKKVVKDF